MLPSLIACRWVGRQTKLVLVNKCSGEVPSKLKCRRFRATSLSTYDFSTLYKTLPHNLIKEKKTSGFDRVDLQRGI